ncbi:MAG: hypothetical protein AAF383_21850 [Cyanobacteria bacterium P01_A01_bin.83]
MIDQLIKEKSDRSRTNQLQIIDTPEQVAEKLFQYLFNADKGIECFPLPCSPVNDKNSEEDNSQQDSSKSDFSQRHKHIKKEVQKRLERDGKTIKYSDLQYFLSYSNGKNNIFFLSPNKNHSGWTQLFKDNRERIFNLVFKYYLLERVSDSERIDTINTFEELFFLHSHKPTTNKKGRVAWGHSLLVRYNHHDVLTLTLTRKRRLFLSRDKKDYKTLDAADLGELLVYKDKNYYFERNLDARHGNSIYFMDFRRDSDNEPKYHKFKQTQVYYYQSLTTKLKEFLTECKIKFKVLDFQADHYLENPFITNIEAVESLEIINNTGIDLTEDKQKFLHNFVRYQGVNNLTFYNAGKTISSYTKREIEGEEDPVWEIAEIIPWSSIELDKDKNYLVFNKSLEVEIGSMAYKRNDGLWCPSAKLDKKNLQIDFYSQLKQKYSYLDTGEFYSIQGINIPEFKIIQKKKQGRQKEGEEKSLSVLTYPSNIDSNSLQQDCQPFTGGRLLNINQSLICYLSEQDNIKEWGRFYAKHNLKIAPAFEKVLIELGIKNWIGQSQINSDISLPITPQSFTEQQFWAIYVRSPKNKDTKAVAVEFLYQDGCIYIQGIMRDLRQIQRKFTFIKSRSNSEKLKDDQQYLVNEAEKIYISCYTDNYYTPTLIGRHSILEELEKEILEINRKTKGKNHSKLFPLAMYYNGSVGSNKIKNSICLDLQQETFIQYYIPSNQPINDRIKKGFRVYHLIGNTYSDSAESIPTSELIKSPLIALHFNTLTQNILKIKENSQSSLLQKIAKVLVNN